jgi:hypothetical protein
MKPSSPLTTEACPRATGNGSFVVQKSGRLSDAKLIVGKNTKIKRQGNIIALINALLFILSSPQMCKERCICQKAYNIFESNSRQFFRKKLDPASESDVKGNCHPRLLQV